eukprot:4384528-Alexandrium_andersonii.AAC.1
MSRGMSGEASTSISSSMVSCVGKPAPTGKNPGSPTKCAGSTNAACSLALRLPNGRGRPPSVGSRSKSPRKGRLRIHEVIWPSIPDQDG